MRGQSRQLEGTLYKESEWTQVIRVATAKLLLTIFTNKYILRLEVTVDYTLFVQVCQREGDLCCEKFGLVFREHANVNQMAEKLATLDELHKEVDPELVLEDVLHVD